MPDHNPLRLLIIGIGHNQITFLERLINGLIDQNIQIMLSHTKRLRKQPKGNHSIQYFWTPPIKRGIFRQVFNLMYLFISSLGSKYRRWLTTQVSQGQSLKDKIGIFIRYAPFCHGDFDVIYFPWNSTAITYKGLFEIGLPVVISCRGSQVNIRPHLPGQDAYVSGLRETLQEAAAVHCVSEDIQQAAQAYGLDPEKAVIIHPAVDPDFFKPLNARPHNKQFKIISTGSLIWRKGYEYLLMALKRLIDKGVDAELHILGEGYMQQPILFTIHDLGLTGRVYMHGRVTPEEVREHLQTSDVFMLSSLSEGISNAVLEAMSCSLPVVSTDCGGMSEAISDGVEGFLVPLRDPKAMADALFKLSANADLRQTMGMASRELVLKQFQLDDQINAFIDLLNSIVVQ